MTLAALTGRPLWLLFFAAYLALGLLVAAFCGAGKRCRCAGCAYDGAAS